MTEREPQQPTGEQRERASTGPEQGQGPWDPQEQVGDIYRADINDEGQIESAERLGPPRIWVGSWLDYNNGVLYGDWLDADRDLEELTADIQALLARSPTAAETGEVAEECGIFDHEGFGTLQIGEQEDLAYVRAVAAGIHRHGDAFAAWAEVQSDGGEIEADELEALERGFEEAYLGEYDSLPAYGQSLVEDLGWQQLIDEALPEGVARWVDINSEGLAQDMWLGGEIHVIHKPGGGVWIFRADV